MWLAAVTDSPRRAAGRCSAGFLCTGTRTSSSALWSAPGSVGSATQQREGRRSHTAARCPSTTSDVRTLPGRGCHCPAAAEHTEEMWRHLSATLCYRELRQMREKSVVKQGSGKLYNLVYSGFVSGDTTKTDDRFNYLLSLNFFFSLDSFFNRKKP